MTMRFDVSRVFWNSFRVCVRAQLVTTTNLVVPSADKTRMQTTSYLTLLWTATANGKSVVYYCNLHQARRLHEIQA